METDTQTHVELIISLCFCHEIKMFSKDSTNIKQENSHTTL